MDNKSILAAAQKNKDKGNEYELKQNIKAFLICTISMLVLIIILFLIDYFVKGVFNVSLIIIAIIAVGTYTLSQGIYFKRIWKIILGAVFCSIALLMILARVVL